MNMLLLGAGASKAAGYPLAAELMDVIQAEAATSREVMLRGAWEEWDSFRRGVNGAHGLLIRNPNPEIVLSLLDLYEIALTAMDEQELRRGVRGEREGAPNAVEVYERYLNSPHREEIEAGIRARGRLLHCLWSYLAWKHHDDSSPDGRRRREYLRRLLGRLEDGDVVGTLNWDTTVERTLAEDGRWSPLDGYGFSKGLLRENSTSGAREELPSDLSRPSNLVVLKPHGSFGWHSHNEDGLYFDRDYYLEEFGFHDGPHRLHLVDPRSPALGAPTDPALLYPSYLKRVRTGELMEVWRRLALAIRMAGEIDVYGYSLPDDDTALRAILLSLRERLESEGVVVRVHDPSSGTHRRWRVLLGDRVQCDGERLL
jgi:hypothetical protein